MKITDEGVRIITTLAKRTQTEIFSAEGDKAYVEGLSDGAIELALTLSAHLIIEETNA